MADWLLDRMHGEYWPPDELLRQMKEDGRAIVRAKGHDALVDHVAGREHDHDVCDLEVGFWEKERRQWL
jgi:hypothetical protein